MIGRTISHYKIVGKLGEGGMGVVYKAQDERLKRTVALKFLPRHLTGDGEEHARFMHEAQAAAALDHPNICTIHEIATVDDDTFIAMAFVEGENLRDRIARGPLPLDEAVTIALQLSNALHEAHTKRVVHRDIKPSNVVISEKGHAILMDFGLAKLHGQTRITQEGTTLGTVAYMSPEQTRGADVDHRSDIWSLGVMLYEMVSGRQPFAGDHQAAVMYAITSSEHTPVTSVRSGVPMELERIVHKMLAKKRDERYQTIDDVRVDLKVVRRELRGGTSASSDVSLRPDTLQRKPGWMLPVVLVGLLAIVAITVFVARDHDGSSTEQTSGQATRAPVKSLENALAVLPLKNLSGDDSNEFLADGMTEELITQLAGIRALKVISRTSIMRYKDSDKPLVQIARELGVGKVLEGSVLWADDRVRISVQLIDGTSDAHLWANSYDSDQSDVLGLQRRVAKAVADEIQLELTPREQAELAKTPVVDREAHELYLQGRYHWNRRSLESLRKSIEYFEAAIAKDPNYAMAYAGLADTYTVLPSWDRNLRPDQGYPKAKEFALKAIALDPSLAGPHAVLGGVSSEYDWNFDEAERHFRRAIELNPNDATAHQWYAEHLNMLARYDEAVREIETALELDPLALIIYNVAIFTYAAAGDETKARDCFDKLRELDPNFAGAFAVMSGVYLRMGDEQKSAEAWTTFLEMTATDDRAREDARRLRSAVNSGIEAYEREALRQDLRDRAERYVLPTDIAQDFAALGEADSAIVWLEKGFKERSKFMPIAATSPRFDPIRSDPRFQDIIRRMGLEDAQERYLESRDRRSL